MNRIIDNFNRLVEKYGFVNPVKPEQQHRAISDTQKNLKFLLIKASNYSYIYGLILALFYWLRTLGLHFSLLQVKIILAVSIISASISSSVGGYYLVKHIINSISEKTDIKLSQETVPDKEKIIIHKHPVVKTIPEKRTVVLLKSMIGIQQFSGIETAITQLVTSSLKKNLSLMLKGKTITFFNKKDRGKFSRMVFGSVRKLEKKIIITAKVINVTNAQIEYVTSESVISIEEIDSACIKLSHRIAQKLQ